MTFSVPSAFAAATSASIPPPAWAEVAVAQALPPEAEEDEPAELTQPTAPSATTAPTAAVTRTRRLRCGDLIMCGSPRERVRWGARVRELSISPDRGI